MNTKEERLVSRAFLALRLCFGVVPIAAGADKFLGLLADWSSYIAPSVEGLLPVEPRLFLMLIGIVEIAVGVLVLTRVRLGALLASGWLAVVAVQLLLAGHLDVAVRDVVLAVAAFALVQLHEALGTTAVQRPAESGSAGATPQPRRT